MVDDLEIFDFERGEVARAKRPPSIGGHQPPKARSDEMIALARMSVVTRACS